MQDVTTEPLATGLSEVSYNALQKHVFVRGYALGGGKPPAISILRDGQAPINPMRTRLPRKDLAAKYPGADARCGFEFLIKASEIDKLGNRFTITVAHDNGVELRLPVTIDDATPRLRAAVSLRNPVINTVEHSITVRGALEEEATGFAFADISLGGHMLHAPQLTMDAAPPAIDGKPARRNFTIRTTPTVLIDNELFQMFPAAGQALKIRFRAPKSDYTIQTSTTLLDTHILSAAGSILKISYAAANGMAELRGAFLGSNTGARVQIRLAGNLMPRSARIEREPVMVPRSLSDPFDSTVIDWTWCDALAHSELIDKIVRAELVAGSRIVGAAELKITRALLNHVEGTLEPSHFVSPHDQRFAALVAEALTPTEDPAIYMVFPGDVFRTHAGGPARVIEMARYCRAMGYALVLIDLTDDAEGSCEVPAAFTDVFHRRIGLPKELLSDYVQLALDHLMRDLTAQSAQDALAEALEPAVTDVTDLILRRRNPRFNALAAFFMGLAMPEFAICSFAWTADILDSLPPATCKILDMHDVQFRRGELHKQVTGEDNYLTSLELEISVLRKADFVLAIQEDDKNFVIEQSGRNNVILCSHAKPLVNAGSVADESRRILFIGNKYPPNTLGLANFLQRNWPHILQAVPDAVLCIVGSVGDDFPAPPPGVEILGRVPELASVYATTAIVINPVEFGTGLNIKTVEAFCHGRCLVTTAFGMRGLLIEDAAVRCTTAETMHEDIIELLLNPAQRRGFEQGAIDFAKRHVVPEAVFRELFNTMELNLSC